MATEARTNAEPGRGETQPRNTSRGGEDGAPEDQPASGALGERPAGERSERVGKGIDEVDEADPGIGLVERLLDRTQQGRDQQPGPPDGQEGQARDDAGREPGAWRRESALQLWAGRVSSTVGCLRGRGRGIVVQAWITAAVVAGMP